MKKFFLRLRFAYVLWALVGSASFVAAQSTTQNLPKYNFLVHITAFGEARPLDYFSSLKGVYRQADDKGIYHYYLGGFSTLQEAEVAKKDVLDKGFKYAYVIDVQKLRRECKVECDKDPVNDLPEPIRAARGIRHLFFDYNRAVLRSDSRVHLTKLENLLRENPSFKVEFRGHADGHGSDTYNQELSERRSKEAKTFLTQRGISASRLDIKGYGKKNPIAKNKKNGSDCPDGRQFNRRVELLIMDTEGNVLNAYVEPISIPTELVYGGE